MRRSSSYRYTIDVLTDGSEAAGSGSTFLSVHKVSATVRLTATAVAPVAGWSQHQQHDEEKEQRSSRDCGVSIEDIRRDRTGNLKRELNHALSSPSSSTPNDDEHDDNDEDRLVLVARYAIGGIGSDLVSRSACDQRFKLGCVRAVFSYSWASGSAASARCAAQAPRSLWALPSLHAALRRSGAGELSVVVPAPSTPSRDQGGANYVEQVARLLHSRSPHPVIRTCQVPTKRITVNDTTASRGEVPCNNHGKNGSSVISICSSTSRSAADAGTNADTMKSDGAKSSKERTNGEETRGEDCDDVHNIWWSVYEDEYVRVHARSVALVITGDDNDMTSTGDAFNRQMDCAATGSSSYNPSLVVEGIVYLYTLLSARGEGVSGRHPSLSSSSQSSSVSILVIPPVMLPQASSSLSPASRFATWVDRVLDPRRLPVEPNSIVLGLAIQPQFPSYFFSDVQEEGTIRERSTTPTEVRAVRRGSDFASVIPWYWTGPTSTWDGTWGTEGSHVLELDPNLLLRAVRAAQDRHDRDSYRFPWSHRRSAIARESAVNACATLLLSQRRLRTGQTLLILLRSTNLCKFVGKIVERVLSIGRNRSAEANYDEDGYVSSHSSDEELDLELDLRGPVRRFSSISHSGGTATVVNPWECSRLALNPDRYDLLDDPAALNQQNPGIQPTATDDDNQIDLDDCLDDHADDEDGTISMDVAASVDTPSVDLLCLGTGCAAPSPHRGSSGYAILLNPTTTFVIDVGEGFVTQWNRHAQHRQCLSTIRIIWISHAHWDHFGGLVPLLSAIHQIQLQQQVHCDSVNCNPEIKRRRTDAPCDINMERIGGRRRSRIPVLVAPDRVLQYVALSLNDRDGTNHYCSPISLRRRDSMAVLSRYLVELSRTETSAQSLPFILTLDKVRVDHCPHAYGLVLAIGLHRRDSNSNNISGSSLESLLFCYSGDTRPCPELVRACHFHSRRHGKAGSIDFLLHEATFSDEDLDLGLKKMHSTVGEACYVARQVGARRTLLTHFSQRYNSVNRGKSSWLLEDGYRVMAAVDGLWIKLSEYRNSFSCQRPFEAVKARACVEAP